MSAASEVPSENHTQRYARWVIENRWLVLALSLVVAFAAASGMPRLGLATDYRTFFSPDNPDLAAFDAVENTYTKNDNVLFVIRPGEGDVFNPRILELVRSLTEDSWQIPNSTRVDGITNFQHTWADGDELIVEDLVGDGEIAAAVVDRAREVSLAEPLLAGRLISPDAGATGINVRISLPGDSKDELPATVEYVRGLLDQYREQYPGVEIYAAGIAMMNWAFAEAPMRDMPVVMPLMFVAFILAIVIFLRSFSAIVGTLGVVMLSTMTALGVAGYIGVLLDPASAAAPTIILTLAVADSIHILVTWIQSLRDDVEKREALVEALRVNAKPVFLTSITTAIGFLSLNFSDSPPFRLLGNVSAFGVMVAWAFSMTLLPAVIAILPAPKRLAARGRSRLDELVSGFSDFVVRRHRPILVGMGALAVLFSFSITRLEINDHYIKYFDEALEIRQASDFTIEHLTGVFNVTYSLEAGGSQEVSDPEYLATVDAFADYLESRPSVIHVNSFTRTMKRLNKNLHEDRPDEYRRPEDQDLAAQYLLLYELSLPYGLDVNDQIDIDKSSLRLDVTFRDRDGNVAVVEEEDRLARAWLAENGTPSMQDAAATGVPMMFAKITRRNIASMVLGTGLGFLFISIILVFALRSARMGFLSLIPNILP
ncbi:MAG: MMPL family transporter, partial [Gemmatimonadetes bacterium]|nr:MMPL family transporter [Gemmatimonadota bacterium]